MEELSLSALKEKSWWEYLDKSQRELFVQSVLLLEREERNTKDQFHDYSFVVFPAAKAYEGFLKRMFFDLRLIAKTDFEGDHFRIGRSLNPSLPERYRDHSFIYFKLADSCGGEETPRLLWEVWKQARNLLFHWFPKKENVVTLTGAAARLEMIFSAMDRSFEACGMRT